MDIKHILQTAIISTVFFTLLAAAVLLCRYSLHVLSDFYAENGGNHIITAAVVSIALAAIFDARNRHKHCK